MNKASTDRVYITPVKKGKEESFKEFLTQEQNIENSKIQSELFNLNKDYYIFHIDLSDKNVKEFGRLRKILNTKQLDFLK